MRSSTIKNAEREVARAEAEVAAEQAHIDQLRERLAPVVDHAFRLAREQAAQAALAAGHAREWAAPRVGAAVERGRLATAPHLEAAVGATAERVVPAVEAARDRIVDDLLPRLADAVHHAAVAGTTATAAATGSVSRTVEEVARSLADATPSARARAARRRRRSRGRWMVQAAVQGAAVAAAAARRAKARQAAAWEVPPTGVPTMGTSADAASAPAADGSAMDVIAAAAGPSDAGVAAPSPLPDADDEIIVTTTGSTGSETEPVDDVAARESAPSTGVDADPVAAGEPSGPETIGIDTGLGETPAAPRGRRG